MKIKDITKISEINNNYNNNVKIGLFANDTPYELLFYCNLIDDRFIYYNLDELMVEDLIKSEVIFDVLFINCSLDLKNIKLLFEYSSINGTKIIYAPNNTHDLEIQENLIMKYDLIISNDYDINKNLKGLNGNILTIPKTLDEQYEFIKESFLFNEENYMLKYKLNTDTFDSIKHYLTLGIYEKCNPFHEFKLNNFLKLYPEIEKYDINPFIYYIILNYLFKFNNYYPDDGIFKHPALSRLILWEINNTIIKDINEFFDKEYNNNFSFDLIEKNNKLLFRQKNKISNFQQGDLLEIFYKTSLMIKHRNSGKRILKEIKNNEVELNGNDLMKFGTSGIYDSYVQLSTFDTDFLFRINFNAQNNNKILIDKENSIIFDPYETADHYVAFKHQKANFIVRDIDVINKNENLIVNGKIELLKNLNFETVEFIMFLNQNDVDKKSLICNFEKYDDIVKFSSKINFKYRATDLIKNFKVAIRLKNISDNVLGTRILKGDKINKLKNNLKKYVKKTVFFESFMARFYSGQPKYIYEKMLELGLDEKYDFVWAYNKEKLKIPGNPVVIKRRSEHYFDMLRASSYWITNISFPILKPNENVIHIHTTHGTPYKRMGTDINSTDKNVTKGSISREVGTWNYLLSPSDYAKDIFKRSFEYDGPIINKGYPANDIFYEDTSIKEQEIKDKLHIDSNKKIILYCPTFRDYEVDEHDRKKYSHVLDLEKICENLGNDYIIIIRLHYSILRQLDLSEKVKNVIMDLSNYDDIADLYLISDILITDYSSVFFDFAHSKKPILFYVPDIEKYSSLRGLYSEVKESLPGPEIYNEDELIRCIRNITDVEKEYANQYNKFYKKFCGLGHGNASEEVINIIFGGE
ncbi:CDP-glycerol glycerophosphotransferase family protein [uncultured Methanobrevibacter sp.]|uniref:CDP-glycerol glycerophosphotransferase family protein n=1 Tax=uncultured Methanobrevibacter sp. TaxID=253161 RepID=UPI0025EC561C|nr:CDP-glycerol glycerophosphotransferase family protein [uncultured Methanobrevibacter sp.]